MKAKIIKSRSYWNYGTLLNNNQVVFNVYDMEEDKKPCSLNGFASADLYLISTNIIPVSMLTSSSVMPLKDPIFIPKCDVQILIEEPIPIIIGGQMYSRSAMYAGRIIHLLNSIQNNMIQGELSFGKRMMIREDDQDLVLEHVPEVCTEEPLIKVSEAKECEAVKSPNDESDDIKTRQLEDVFFSRRGFFINNILKKVNFTIKKTNR